jgi:chaperonin cofactor prefoldin
MFDLFDAPASAKVCRRAGKIVFVKITASYLTLNLTKFAQRLELKIAFLEKLFVMETWLSG